MSLICRSGTGTGVGPEELAARGASRGSTSTAWILLALTNCKCAHSMACSHWLWMPLYAAEVL